MSNVTMDLSGRVSVDGIPLSDAENAELNRIVFTEVNKEIDQQIIDSVTCRCPPRVVTRDVKKVHPTVSNSTLIGRPVFNNCPDCHKLILT